jgi:hypothetical protein
VRQFCNHPPRPPWIADGRNADAADYAAGYVAAVTEKPITGGSHPGTVVED